MRYALAMIGLACAITAAVPARAQEEMSDGWWVVVGSLKHDRDLGHGAMASDRFFLAADRCGAKTNTFQSRQFSRMQPGFTVVVSGPFNTELKARATLAQIGMCSQGAYIMRSEFSGE